MHSTKLPYFIFLAVMLVFNGMIFVTPVLAQMNDPNAGALYAVFGPTCHQLTHRSLCLYEKSGIGDCAVPAGQEYTHENIVINGNDIGYKFPVCSRDVAIYLAMLIGLIALPFLQKIESEDWPNKWILVAAVAPLAIDGVTQLAGFRESTNFLRLVTGALAGVVLPFYILPILNGLWKMGEEHLVKAKAHGKKK